MINTQLALVRRELWEHRAIYVVPAVLILLVSLTSVTGQVAISSLEEEVNLAILGTVNMSENERGMAVTGVMFGISWLFFLTMIALSYFYALDALYAERKDKSILFWRSLPVTDSATVVSKLLTAAVVIPLVTFVAILLTHVIVLVISSIWVGLRGVDAWSLIWSAAPLIENWTATLIGVLVLPIWSAPFIGWFLFVSAFAKRSPFLFAVLPLIVIPMLERILFGTSVFAEMLYDRNPFNMPILKDMPALENADFEGDDLLALAESGVNVLQFIDIGRFLTSGSVWIGVIVSGLFCSAAVYVRRYRDES